MTWDQSGFQTSWCVLQEQTQLQMFLLTTSSFGSRGPGIQRRPLTPTQAPPGSTVLGAARRR